MASVAAHAKRAKRQCCGDPKQPWLWTLWPPIVNHDTYWVYRPCYYPGCEPTNPGVQPDPTAIATATSAKEITELHKAHDKDVKSFEEYMAADRLLVKLIVTAVEDVFISTLKNEYTGYSGVRCRDLFKHLLDTYANIDEFDLQTNQQRMQKPYDPHQPIEELYRQIAEAQAYADAGNASFTPLSRSSMRQSPVSQQPECSMMISKTGEQSHSLSKPGITLKPFLQQHIRTGSAR